MSLPRKGSRSIEVDGLGYRWIVNDVDLGAGPELALYVECFEHPAGLMRALVGSEYSITPSLVRHAIRQAVNRGWTPQEPGPLYELPSRSLDRGQPVENRH